MRWEFRLVLYTAWGDDTCDDRWEPIGAVFVPVESHGTAPGIYVVLRRPA